MSSAEYILHLTYSVVWRKVVWNRVRLLSSQLLRNPPDHLKSTAQPPGISSLVSAPTILNLGHDFDLQPPTPEKGIEENYDDEYQAIT